MEFTDNVTPGYGTYWQNTVNNSPWTVGRASKEADAYNQWAQLYYPNAFQVAMLNYQNEYDKPINQMLRWQEAGLNPYAFQPSQGASGAQGSKPGSGTPFSSLQQDKVNTALRAVSTSSQALSVARELYDYLNFGKEIRSSELLRAQADASRAQSEADWALYWNYGEGMGPNSPAVQSSPRAQYMANSSERISAQINQLNSLVDTLYPSQVEANAARAALQDYQKQIQQGNYDAILSINTGNKTVDAILRMLCMMIMNNIPSIGFSGKI